MQSELLQRVRCELGRRAECHLEAVSQYLAAAVAAYVAIAAPEVVESARNHLHQGRADALEALSRHAGAAARSELGNTVAALQEAGLLPASHAVSPFARPDYLDRVVHLALERLLVNAGAPPVLIAPSEPSLQSGELAAARVVAVCFDQPLAITHELYPLCTDAYVFNMEEHLDVPLELVGVHDSWLDAEGRIQRGIRYSPELDAFIESSLSVPQMPHAALVVAHSRQGHQKLSACLEAAGVPHVNRAAIAAVADDKWLCWQRWNKHKVPTPRTVLLPAAVSPGTQEEFLHQALNAAIPAPAGWIIQPRHGTEGRGITWVPDNADCTSALLAAWAAIARHDDAILRPRIGLLGVGGHGGPVAWDLRINVCFNGSAHRATSAYVLVAAGADSPIASVSAGGRTESVEWLGGTQLFDLLDPATPAVAWSPPLLDQAVEVAEQAVATTAPLGLAGVDVKFDREGTEVRCSVLDINPRPAGLLHANLLTTKDAGIGSALWHGLIRLIDSSTSSRST